MTRIQCLLLFVCLAWSAYGQNTGSIAWPEADAFVCEQIATMRLMRMNQLSYVEIRTTVIKATEMEHLSLFDMDKSFIDTGKVLCKKVQRKEPHALLLCIAIPNTFMTNETLSTVDFIRIHRTAHGMAPWDCRFQRVKIPVNEAF